MTITTDDLVRREVFYCVSSLVSTLAQGYYGATVREAPADLVDLTEQAFDLASPVADWEETAQGFGDWTGPHKDDFGATYFLDRMDGTTWACADWEALCRDHDAAAEPVEREVYEHWLVSDWLADKLEAKGEKVDRDFAGMTIWARTTTGQGIASDWVVEQIVQEINNA